MAASDCSKMALSDPAALAESNDRHRDAKRKHRFLVQELSGDKPGQMRDVLPLLQPQIGIVTCIGQDHYVNFRSLEATAQEKGQLIATLPPGGVAVLNADDPHVAAMQELARTDVITYGRCEGAQVRGTEIRASWPDRLSLMVTFRGQHARIETGLFGDLLVPSLLAAVAGGVAAGVSLVQCAASLQNVATFPRRLSIHRGLNGAWFISDTCKAPVWSVPNVLALLKDVRAPRKTMVFGSFSDNVGSDSSKYRRMAKEALKIADRVIFTGPKAMHIRELLTPETQGRLFMLESIRAVALCLSDDLVGEEVVLIKSSNRNHLERLIYGQSESLACWKEICANN